MLQTFKTGSAEGHCRLESMPLQKQGRQVVACDSIHFVSSPTQLCWGAAQPEETMLHCVLLPLNEVRLPQLRHLTPDFI